MKGVDWARFPWWVRPLVAISWGFGVALTLSFWMSWLGRRAELVGVGLLVTLSVMYCVWALYDLRKMRREYLDFLQMMQDKNTVTPETADRLRQQMHRFF